MTTDTFGNAFVLYSKTLPAVQKALTWARGTKPFVPIVTGFLGRGQLTGAANFILFDFYEN